MQCNTTNLAIANRSCSASGNIPSCRIRH